MSDTVLGSVLNDVAAESQQLDAWVRDLPASRWQVVTTAEGWTIAHQIGHLAWTDDASLTAIRDPDEFGALMKAAAANPSGFVDDGAAQWAELPPATILSRWRRGRDALSTALESAEEKIAWFGPPMSPASMATARIMETWAHARDVATALDIEAPRDHRARHVAHLGVRTRDFAYWTREQEPPQEAFRVDLTGPDGEPWQWGPEDAAQRVTGDGYDFALLATRRLHRDDADVQASGEDARHWLGIVQAFAGQPGTDPARKPERKAETQ